VERNVKSTRAKPVEAAMVARAAFGSLLIAAPAALIVTLVSLAFLLRGPTYAPSALLEVDQGQESRHSGLSVPVPRPRTPFYLVRAIAARHSQRGHSTLGVGGITGGAPGQLDGPAPQGHESHTHHLRGHRPKEGNAPRQHACRSGILAHLRNERGR
jgi:hypothetical protein